MVANIHMINFAPHLASFRERDRAVRFSYQLQGQGFPAFFREQQIQGEYWFRVYVGPYQQRSQAQQASREVQAKGLGNYFFISRINNG